MHCPGFSTGHALKMAHTEATAAKNQGNACFKKRDWAGAIVAYSEGVAIDPTWEVLYSNRSQAYFQLKKYEKAYADAQSCMKVKPDYVKGYHRGANALVRMDRYTDALAVLDAGYKKGFRANKDLSKLDDLIRPKAEIQKAQQVKKNAPPGTNQREGKCILQEWRLPCGDQSLRNGHQRMQSQGLEAEDLGTLQQGPLF